MDLMSADSVFSCFLFVCGNNRIRCIFSDEPQNIFCHKRNHRADVQSRFHFLFISDTHVTCVSAVCSSAALLVVVTGFCYTSCVMWTCRFFAL